jgi:hypothetical protein
MMPLERSTAPAIQFYIMLPKAIRTTKNILIVLCHCHSLKNCCASLTANSPWLRGQHRLRASLQDRPPISASAFGLLANASSVTPMTIAQTSVGVDGAPLPLLTSAVGTPIETHTSASGAPWLCALSSRYALDRTCLRATVNTDGTDALHVYVEPNATTGLAATESGAAALRAAYSSSLNDEHFAARPRTSAGRPAPATRVNLRALKSPTLEARIVALDALDSEWKEQSWRKYVRMSE